MVNIIAFIKVTKLCKVYLIYYMGVIILLHMFILRHDFYESIFKLLALDFPLKILSKGSFCWNSYTTKVYKVLNFYMNLFLKREPLTWPFTIKQL